MNFRYLRGHSIGFHILIGHAANGFLEHESESCGFVQLARVVPVHGLVDVPLQVSLVHEVIGSEHHPLEVSPKSLTAVCGNSAFHILPDSMPYHIMLHALPVKACI